MTYVQSKRKKQHTPIKIIVVAMLLITIIALFGLKSAASENSTTDIRTYTSVQVAEGDTLWEIASRINEEFYNGKVNIKTLIENIRTENQIQSIVIQPGEILKIATDLK